MQTLNHAWQAYILSIWFFDTGNRARVTIQIDWNWIFFDSRQENWIWNWLQIQYAPLRWRPSPPFVPPRCGPQAHLGSKYNHNTFYSWNWFYSCKRHFMTFMLIIFILDLIKRLMFMNSKERPGCSYRKAWTGPCRRAAP